MKRKVHIFEHGPSSSKNCKLCGITTEEWRKLDKKNWIRNDTSGRRFMEENSKYYIYCTEKICLRMLQK